MSRQEWHPDADALFRADLGELPPGEAAKVQQHLGICEQCRREFEELHATVAGFTDFYQNEYKMNVPPPPRAWYGFRPELRAAAAKRRGVWERLRSAWRTPRLAPVAVAVGMLLLAATVAWRLRDAPAASAKEVLDRAEAFQAQHLARMNQAAVFQRLQVRVGRRTLTRTVYRDILRRRQVDRWLDQEAASVPLTVAPVMAAELARDFKAVHLDWDDPLSASGIRNWYTERAGRWHATGSVRQSAGFFTLSSVAAEQPVTEAEFVLRAADYHPVSARLRFQGRPSDVELTELEYEVRSLDSLDAVTRAQLSAVPAEPVERIAAKTPAPVPAQDLAVLELDAWYALHRHNADLGGEAQVQRTAGGVAVKGLVASEERRSELRAALRGVPGVRVDLQTVAEAATQQSHTLVPGVDAGERPVVGVAALHAVLKDRFPEQQSLDSFVLATMEASQHALARGFALERLAARYPADTEAELPEEGRARLRTMVLEHQRALSRNLEALIERMDSVAGVTESAPAPGEPVVWQAAQASLLRSLQRLDRLATALVSDSSFESADPAALVREYHECAARARAELRRSAAGGE